MLIIDGKSNSAKCFASVVTDDAISQIKRICDQPFTNGSKIRIMPDVHRGKGCTIGTTMTIKDKIVPNLVGVDIGCGMMTINIGQAQPDFEKIDTICKHIPHGNDVWKQRREKFDFSKMKCFSKLEDVERLGCSLGTLGGGNHFIEVDKSDDGSYYLVIHSGSRNLGTQVAQYYQNQAIKLHSGDGVPADLCYLDGKLFDDYIHDVELCQKFAKRNRQIIADIIISELRVRRYESFNTIHNYVDTKEMILRKGAIAAHEGEKVLIPINMRDGSIIAIGKGNADWNYSAPHGAGRILSRTAARKCLTLEEYQREMEGIYTTSVCASTLDEAPMAYKSLEDIIDDVKESVNIVEIIKPVYNFKAK